jgi:Flp pilus assembly pilin Flp
MRKIFAAIVRDDRAQDLAEYGIALAVIVIGVVLISVAISGNVQTLWTNAQTNIQSVIDAEP